jgi:hypothetical protein
MAALSKFDNFTNRNPAKKNNFSILIKKKASEPS